MLIKLATNDSECNCKITKAKGLIDSVNCRLPRKLIIYMFDYYWAVWVNKDLKVVRA